MSRPKLVIVAILAQLPLCIAKPLGSVVRFVWPRFRSA
jgi:hypothetical protein